MRVLAIAALALSFALPLGFPAEAQTQRLPRKSSSERHVEEINRNLRQGERLQQYEQQNRVDNNLLRQQIDRDRILSTPPPPVVRICPGGAGRC